MISDWYLSILLQLRAKQERKDSDECHSLEKDPKAAEKLSVPDGADIESIAGATSATPDLLQSAPETATRGSDVSVAPHKPQHGTPSLHGRGLRKRWTDEG